MYETQFFYNASSTLISASTTPVSGEISTSSDIKTLPVFTAGDLLIAALLLIVIVLHVCDMTLQFLSKIKVGRKRLQYGGGDVDIIEY